jgi:hypothetical protein
LTPPQFEFPACPWGKKWDETFPIPIEMSYEITTHTAKTDYVNYAWSVRFAFKGTNIGAIILSVGVWISVYVHQWVTVEWT